MSIALGLFLVRLVVGALIITHGAQKLFGWFGGSGLQKSIAMMQMKGFRPAEFWALLGGLGEFGGGVLLILGFLWPLGPVAIFAAMVMAIVRFHLPGPVIGPKGFEYPLLLLLLSVILGLVGAGHIALDVALGLHLPTTALFWIGAVGAVIVDAIGYNISNANTKTQQTVAKQG
jgi:putative oxidoreductase